MLWERTFSYTGHCFEAIAYFVSIVFLQNRHLRFLKSFCHMQNATVNDTTYIFPHKIKFSIFFSELGQLSIRRTLILVPTVSVLERVDCISYCSFLHVLALAMKIALFFELKKHIEIEIEID